MLNDLKINNTGNKKKILDFGIEIDRNDKYKREITRKYFKNRIISNKKTKR